MPICSLRPGRGVGVGKVLDYLARAAVDQGDVFSSIGEIGAVLEYPRHW